ncbi:hypothetical protein DMUE_3208 [Dictyocoela muelleri]|nr:hypothetical protein DMUE_3208 [Dictyocoela muelleri]
MSSSKKETTKRSIVENYEENLNFDRNLKSKDLNITAPIKDFISSSADSKKLNKYEKLIYDSNHFINQGTSSSKSPDNGEVKRKNIISTFSDDSSTLEQNLDKILKILEEH